jgi:aspartate kinase
VPIVVQKYGGTSVDGREKLMQVAARVAALRGQGFGVVVVVSAQGGTTDSLLKEARGLAAEPAQRELDMLMTAGERVSMSLLAIALNSMGCPAVSFTGSQVGIITDTRHTDARILEVRPQRVVRELERGAVVVVGGFQGVSTEKEVTTLGRGGSDTTAIALAAALGAERCEILTDVDAVYTADPRIVGDARPIAEISYEDMAALARFGATVLKEEAVRFAERAGIAISVGSSAGIAPGTIVLDGSKASEPPIVGIALLSDACILDVSESSLIDAREKIAGLGRAVRYVAAGGGRVEIAVDRAEVAPRARAILSAAAPACLLCAVGPDAGSGRATAGAAAVMAGAGVEVLGALSCGRTMTLTVQPEEGEAALKALHTEFFSTPSGRGSAKTSSPFR